MCIVGLAFLGGRFRLCGAPDSALRRGLDKAETSGGQNSGIGGKHTIEQLFGK